MISSSFLFHNIKFRVAMYYLDADVRNAIFLFVMIGIHWK